MFRAWKEENLNGYIMKVYRWLQIVLYNIIEEKGDNDLAETDRGKNVKNKLEDLIK